MKYELNLCIGLFSTALGIFDCIRAIDSKIIISEPHLILGIILIACAILEPSLEAINNGIPRPRLHFLPN